jgi:hypothetical protein
LVLYNRVSTGSGAGRGQEKLRAKTYAVEDQIQAMTDRRIRRLVYVIEKGKLSARRPGLIDAADSASHRRAILVAPDLSRFIRSEAYDRLTEKRHAWPTEAEFDRLHEVTFGVPLATLLPPLLSEDERHSLATRRTGKAGRPRSIDDQLMASIFEAEHFGYIDGRGRWHWSYSLLSLARRHGVSKHALLRAANRPSPDGRTWKERAIAWFDAKMARARRYT